MINHVLVPTPKDAVSGVIATAFQAAMSATNPRTATPALLKVIGESFGAKRGYVYQLAADGREFVCAYEWCADGVEPMSEVNHGITMGMAARWFGDDNPRSLVAIRDIGKFNEVSAGYAALFALRGTRSQVLGKLLRGNHPMGVLGFDDPDPAYFDALCSSMYAICAFATSTINAQHLLGQIRTAGMVDRLTGAGTRMGFYQRAESLPADICVGMAYLDVVGLQGVNDVRGWEAGDDLLVSIRLALITEFNDDQVFRMAGDEFLVFADGMPETSFHMAMRRVRRRLDEFSAYVALGIAWQPRIGDHYNQMLNLTWLSCVNDKQEWEHRGGRRLSRPVEDGGDPSDDEMPRYDEMVIDGQLDLGGCFRSDEFFQRASVWVRHVDAPRVCAMAFDANYFKLYNDIFGRDAGNRLLESYAKGLTRLARHYHGVAGYVGGDNFVLMVPSAADTTDERIREIIEAELAFYDVAEGFSPACGVVVTSDYKVGPTILYDRALVAMQSVKGSYTNHVAFYDVDRYHHERENQMLLMRTKEALAQGEFFFVLQPKVNIRTNKVVSAEALVRWFTGEELINTGRFVNLMESSGYIFALDRYIWDSVCCYQRHLIDAGVTPVPISVNVSRIDFHFTDLADHFRGLVERYRLDPSLVGIEVTESAYSEDASINDEIRQLQRMGFTILMDDFGSGYSSLNMLRDVALDVLKMDKGFVDHVALEDGSDAIISSIIRMAHMLGMPVIMEGVETKEQRDALLAMGCDYIQGFYYYGPIDQGAFEDLLRKGDAVERGHGDSVILGAND